jgi:glycosyltransferase involved in cell wall biosynthesis
VAERDASSASSIFDARCSIRTTDDAEGTRHYDSLIRCKRLRIIHLGKYYPPASGGIEGHTATLARGQARYGHTVEVVVVDGRRRTPSRVDSDGSLRVHRVGRVVGAAKCDVAPRLLSVLRKLISTKPDVWHLHAPNVTMMLALSLLPAVRPLVITHHSDIVRQRYLYKLFAPLERLILSRAKLILPTSAHYAGGSPALAAFPEKVRPLPLGIDLQPYCNPSAEALQYSQDVRAKYPGPIWLCVGRLIYYKALSIAFEALRRTPGTLIVVGTGPLEEAWRTEAARLGVANRVVWHGRTPESQLVGLLHAATALWFPSNARSEGFGLVQVEAMAAGCPVVNCHIPHSGVPWVCQDNRAGLTVAPNDPAAFAAAAQRLLDEPGLRNRLSADAVREARSRFDESTMIDESIRLYGTILA